MYCECRVRMFNFLNSSQQDFLFPVFIIILITLFCNLTFTQRDLNGYSQPLRTTLFSLGI